MSFIVYDSYSERSVVMKIKNYIVENYQLFMSYLEKELCKNSISYVKIDNEIHFLDQIIRFYDFNLDRKEIIIWAIFNSIEETNKISDNIFCLQEQQYIQNIKLDKENRFVNQTKNYNTRNKYIQKQESITVKQKLKRFSR